MIDYFEYQSKALRETAAHFMDTDFEWSNSLAHLLMDSAETIEALSAKDANVPSKWFVAAKNLYHLVRDLNLNEIVSQIASDSLHSWLRSWQRAADTIYNADPQEETTIGDPIHLPPGSVKAVLDKDPPFMPKKESNFDRITNSPETMAEFMHEMIGRCPPGLAMFVCSKDCSRCWEEWLNKEASDDA